MIRVSPITNETLTRLNMFYWINDPDVMKGILKKEPVHWKEHKIWFENALKDEKNKHFMIMRDDEHIGMISIKKTDHDQSELMIFIGDECNRGKGYGYKALREFLKNRKYKLVITVSEKNHIAKHLYHRCGFKEEKVFKDAFIQDGKPINVVKMVRE